MTRRMRPLDYVRSEEYRESQRRQYAARRIDERDASSAYSAALETLRLLRGPEFAEGLRREAASRRPPTTLQRLPRVAWHTTDRRERERVRARVRRVARREEAAWHRSELALLEPILRQESAAFHSEIAPLLLQIEREDAEAAEAATFFDFIF